MLADKWILMPLLLRSQRHLFIWNVTYWCNSACFSRKQNLLKSIDFYVKTPTKQILIFFRTRPGESVIWQKPSAMWYSKFKPLKTFDRSMLCVTILFNHLVCVCVIHLCCVYVVTLSHHHSIFVLFIYQSPSHLFCLPQPISFIPSAIVHLIHFIYHSSSHSFYWS